MHVNINTSRDIDNHTHKTQKYQTDKNINIIMIHIYTTTTRITYIHTHISTTIAHHIATQQHIIYITLHQRLNSHIDTHTLIYLGFSKRK